MLHQFGTDLREWRVRRALSQRALGQLVHASGDLIGKVEKAERWPSTGLIDACDAVLHAGGELAKFHAQLDRDRRGRGTLDPSEPAPSDAEFVGRAVDLGGHRELLISWHALLENLAAAGNTNGYAGMALTARVQIQAAERIARNATGANRRDLLIAQALWAEFLSWIDDQGTAASAGAWLHLAHGHAVQAEDPALTSYILMRQSQQAIEQSDPGRAVALADQALAQTPLPARTRALGLIRQAQAYALGGDEKASLRCIGHAYRLADGALNDSGLPFNVSAHCSPTYVAAHEAQCRLLLGQPAPAADLYEQLLRRWPAQWRVDEGIWRSGLAGAYVASGQPDRAAAEAIQALSIAQDTRSARTMRTLAPTAVALRRHPGLPEAAGFVSAYRRAALGACQD